MANSIIHFLLFGLFFSLFEPDLGLRLRIAGSLSRGLPFSGAASLPRGLPSSGAASLPRGLPSFGAASLPGGLPSFDAASLPGGYRLSVRHRLRGDCRLPKQDASAYYKGACEWRVRFRGYYRLPARYRGDYRLSKRDASAYCKGEA